MRLPLEGDRKEEGQVLPVLLLLVVALVAVGVALLPVGQAADMRAHAQTAADAAALAGAQDLAGAAKASLASSRVAPDQVAPGLVGSSTLSGADPCGAADSYARRNATSLIDCKVLGRDVLVAVKTDETLNSRRSQEQARARFSVVLPPASRAALSSLTATTTTTIAGQQSVPQPVDPLQYLELRARLVPLGG